MTPTPTRGTMPAMPAAAVGDEVALFEPGLCRLEETKTGTPRLSRKIGPMRWGKEPWSQTICLQLNAHEENEKQRKHGTRRGRSRKSLSSFSSEGQSQTVLHLARSYEPCITLSLTKVTARIQAGLYDEVIDRTIGLRAATIVFRRGRIEAAVRCSVRRPVAVDLVSANVQVIEGVEGVHPELQVEALV